MTHVAAALALLAAAGVPHVAAQYTFQYDPPPGAVVHSRTVERTVATLFGFVDVPDGFTYEEERRIDATLEVRGQRDGRWVVDVTVDSVPHRRRVVDGGWRAVIATGPAGGTARLMVDSRFRASVVSSSGARAVEATLALGGGVAGPGFGFPAGPVVAGAPFPTDGRVLFSVTLDPETGTRLQHALSAPLELTLDSVGTGGADELAYLQFRGTFDPADSFAESESGATSVTLSGSFAGRLIWSRGWNALVSGAVRVQVDARVQVVDAAGARDAAVNWQTTLTHQVRP